MPYHFSFSDIFKAIKDGNIKEASHALQNLDDNVVEDAEAAGARADGEQPYDVTF